MKESAKNLVKEILNKRDLLGRGNLFEKAVAGDETLQGAVVSMPVDKGQTTLANDLIYTNMPTLMQLKPTGKVKSAGGGIKPIPTEIESLIYSFPTLQDFLESLSQIPDGYEVGVVDSSEEVAAGFLENLGTNNAYFDLDGDGVVTQADFSIYVNEILGPALVFTGEIPGDFDAPDPRPIMPGIGLDVGIEGGDPDMPETGGPLVPSGEEPDAPIKLPDPGDRPVDGGPLQPPEDEPEEDPGLEFPMIEYAGNFIAAYGGTSFNPFTDPAFIESLYMNYIIYSLFYGQEGLDFFIQYYGDPADLFGEDNLIDMTDLPEGDGGEDVTDPVDVIGDDGTLRSQLDNGEITLDDIQDMLVAFITGEARDNPDLRYDPYYVSMFDFDGNGYVDTNDFRFLKAEIEGSPDDSMPETGGPFYPGGGEPDGPGNVEEIDPDGPRGGGPGQPNPLGRRRYNR